MNEAGLMDSQFRIAADRVGPAQDAALRLAEHAMEEEKEYAWVATTELAAATNLQETFHAWGWQLCLNRDGDVCGIDGPSGDRIGDEKALFDAIAPFVENGSYIQIIYDSDNSIWRWIFTRGRCFEVKADLVFPLPADCRA